MLHGHPACQLAKFFQFLLLLLVTLMSTRRPTIPAGLLLATFLMSAAYLDTAVSK